MPRLGPITDGRPSGEREAVQSAIHALKDALESEDVEQIKAKTEALGQLAMKLGEAMYRAQQAPGGDGGPQGGAGPGSGQPGGGAGGPGGDKVVDADFEEVDDQKKRGSA